MLSWPQREMTRSPLFERLKRMGSAAAVAAAVLTQPAVSAASSQANPIVNAALASFASRSERKESVASLILQPAKSNPIEFVGHLNLSVIAPILRIDPTRRTILRQVPPIGRIIPPQFLPIALIIRRHVRQRCVPRLGPHSRPISRNKSRHLRHNCHKKRSRHPRRRNDQHGVMNQNSLMHPFLSL